MMDAKLKIAMTALRKITKVPRAEFDMTTVAKIAQTAFFDIDAIAPPVAGGGSVDLHKLVIEAQDHAEKSEARVKELEAQIATDDHVLRSSVPERWKDCASPVGAVQSYIAELEETLKRYGYLD